MAFKNLTGYGPKYTRIFFYGDESSYEIWETKFHGYLRTLQLHNIIDAPSDQPEDPHFVDKNATIYAELIQCLGDQSLSLVMREAKDDGRKSMEILRTHYLSKGKPRIVGLYRQLSSLNRTDHESITDYIIQTESIASSLREAEEIVSDGI